jgi:protoporphyrinogen oxidase
MKKKTALIIGAGPAGLTAAYELIHRTDITPIIFEKTDQIGGISKTVKYKGNRIDIGGHRFFSKSDRVMDWWLNIMPMQEVEAGMGETFDITYHKQKKSLEVKGIGKHPDRNDRVMMIRNRLSRIFYLRKFFSYPISLSVETIANLGILRTMKIGFSYIRARAFPIREERSLEDFLINRFGRELYHTFFKDYTHKVWGVECRDIPPEWGAQRIKGLSITKAILHAVRQLGKKDDSVRQKGTETSLIEKFLYPKFGPGQMWEEVADIVQEKGGRLHLKHAVVSLDITDSAVSRITVRDMVSGENRSIEGDYVFSTMPVRELIMGMNGKVPDNVISVAQGLQYRDFMTLGLLLNKLKVKNNTKIASKSDLIPDNWIYIQERDVKIGRLQIFNNWSPYMVKDKDKVWIGLEYFCNEDDELWSKQDDDFAKLGIEELAKIDIIDQKDVLDHVVIRMPKTYPAYFGTYNRFDEIKKFTNQLENLFMIGRNGMHKYNNQDHSMLTAMQSVDNIIAGVVEKDNIWEVNTEEEYHESK